MSDTSISTLFPFRPWVRRAGLSIVAVAAIVSGSIIAALALHPAARFGWIGEKFVWIYIGTLWAGGLKVWLGAGRPVAEIREAHVILRPLHLFGSRIVPWDRIRGTEQMIGGDRMIVFYESARGPRFVALNLNLIKGRKEFLKLMDTALYGRGFVEKIVERSRYLSRPA